MYEDSESHDVPDLDAARRLALHALSDMVSELLKEGRDRASLGILVRNETGSKTYKVDLVITSDG